MKLCLKTKSKARCVVFFYGPQKIQSKTKSNGHGRTKVKGEKNWSFYPDLKPSFQKDLLDQKKSKTGDSVPKESFFYRQIDSSPHVLLVPLGKNPMDGERVRSLSASIYKRLKSENIPSASIDLSSFPMEDKEEALICFAEGFTLSDYCYDTFKKNVQNFPLEVDFTIPSIKPSLKRALHEGEIMGAGVNWSRWMGDSPGNVMTPSQMAKEAQKSGKIPGVKVTVWNKARIIKEKMDSLIGVSNGSSQEPRFIIMEYKGTTASKKPICFVGKGLTFDCGGISIKPSAAMEEMKFDMCGGAAVIATMTTIARLGLKVNAMGLIPSSENMPGPAANKPGDIRRARNGISIEINNTDAEGRLILADALSYASEKKPALIVDVATLTGAMLVALSNIHTGFFTRDEKVRKMIEESGLSSGEKLWAMPLCDEHREDMKGHYGDLSNISKNRGGGSATAAAFLENFVDPSIPWVHLDIAGTGWHVGNRLAYAPKKGASGVMVRTFVHLARKFFT